MHNWNQLHSFAARCPRGHRPPQLRTLTDLRSPAVSFYCALCEASWTPAAEERARAIGFAEASERASDSAPPAA